MAVARDKLESDNAFVIQDGIKKLEEVRRLGSDCPEHQEEAAAATAEGKDRLWEIGADDLAQARAFREAGDARSARRYYLNATFKNPYDPALKEEAAAHLGRNVTVARFDDSAVLFRDLMITISSPAAKSGSTPQGVPPYFETHFRTPADRAPLLKDPLDLYPSGKKNFR